MKSRYIAMIGDYWSTHDTREKAMEYGMKQPKDFTIVHQIYDSRHRRYKSIKQETIEHQLKLFA